MNCSIQDICCFCLNMSNEKCSDKSSEYPNNLTPFDKIKTVLLELSAVMCSDSRICLTCNKNVDFIYEFNKTCLRNINILNSYKKVLEENNPEKNCELFVNLDEWKRFKNTLVSEREIESSGSNLTKDKTLYNADFVSKCQSRDVAEVKQESQINYVSCDEVSERPWLEPEIKIEIEETDVKQEKNSEISEPSIVGSLQPNIKDFENISVQPTEEMVDGKEEKQESIEDPLRGVAEEKWDESKTHTGKDPVQCDFCNKFFSRKPDLKRHLLIHTGEKPHKCDTCGKLFTLKDNLKKHILIHTGEKSHECDICGKLFSYKGDLKTHYLIHTGEKPHKCDICGKLFSQTGTLNSHKLIHTGEKPHKCNVCGKLFRRKENLNRHYLIHTGEKPHKCNICGKLFNQMGTLNTHKLVHTGEKSHKCDICGKSFKRKDYLDKHLLTHKNKKIKN